MKKLNFFGMVAVAATMVLFSCEKDELIDITSDDVKSVENFSTRPGQTSGQSSTSNYYADLTKEWWKYVLSFDCGSNPLNFTSLPASPVKPGSFVFLVGSADGSATRTLNVTRSQLLVVPVINTLSKYPCASFSSVPGASIEQILQADADKFIDQATNMKVLLDGAAIKISNANRYATNVFSVKGQADLSNCIDACITGQQQTAVSDGYWLFLRGLSRGKHTLTIHAEILQTGVVIDVKYIINVV